MQKSNSIGSSGDKRERPKGIKFRYYGVLIIMVLTELATMYIIQNSCDCNGAVGMAVGVFLLALSVVLFFVSSNAYIKKLKTILEKDKK